MNQPLLETLKQARDDVLSVADFAHKTDVVIGWAERVAVNLTAAIEQLEKAEPVAWMVETTHKASGEKQVWISTYRNGWGNMESVTYGEQKPLYTHPAAQGEKK